MVRFDPRGSNAFAPAAHLAALHLHYLARRFVAHPDQHADALDVWTRTGISLGKAPLSELLYFIWGWCRSHRGGRQDRSCVLRSTTLFSTHHWRFRGDFRHPDGYRGALSSPPHLADSSSRHHSYASVRGSDGGYRVLLHDWRRWRQCQSHLPSGRYACWLSLPPPRLVLV